MDSDPPAPAIEPFPETKGKSPLVAVLLEIFPGILQVFGLGSIYAGNFRGGLLLMFSYWFAALVNFVLLLFGVGVISYPVTWLAFMIISPLVALSKLQDEEPESEAAGPPVHPSK